MIASSDLLIVVNEIRQSSLCYIYRIVLEKSER